VSGSDISWAICKSAPRSRQITTPAPHHSVFTDRMPFLPPNQQRQSTEGNAWYIPVNVKLLWHIGLHTTCKTLLIDINVHKKRLHLQLKKTTQGQMNCHVLCVVCKILKKTDVSTHTYVQHIPNIPQHYLAKGRTHSSDGSCIVSLKTVVMKSGGCCKF